MSSPGKTLKHLGVDESVAETLVSRLDDIETALRVLARTHLVERKSDGAGSIEYSIINCITVDEAVPVERMERLAETPLAGFTWGLGEEDDGVMRFTVTPLGSAMIGEHRDG